MATHDPKRCTASLPGVRGTLLAGAAFLCLSTHAGSRELVLLHTFSGGDGIEQRGSMIVGPDGALYGTSYWGGTYNLGTIFRQALDGTFTVLHTFVAASGDKPNSGLTLGPDGRLWGTGSEGGDSDQGVIFSIDTQGNYQVHYSFDGTHGGFVYPGVTFGADGMIYGATTGGGANKHGVLYKFDPATAAYTVLYSFMGGGRGGGEEPYATLLLASDGNFYGSTYFGSQEHTNRGVIYRLTPQGEFSVVHSLSIYGNEGCHPAGVLADGGDGRLYGTATDCGANRVGTIFSVAISDHRFSTLWSFKSRCEVPWQGVTLGPDGLFYGTATYGGDDDGESGCVYSMTPAGAVRYIHRFTAADGTGAPKSGVTFAGKTMYGLTSNATWKLVKQKD
jgi:uncharacterized repeat protein (TIGR03803 family)